MVFMVRNMDFLQKKHHYISRHANHVHVMYFLRDQLLNDFVVRND